MSSTQRSAEHNFRRAGISDYYRTPIEPIAEFLHQFELDYPEALVHRILDPCAGGDAKHPMSYPEALKLCGRHDNVLTLDIRADSPAQEHGDYLKWHPPIAPWLIITNPPFALAQQIIEKALHDVEVGGFVVMLLRLNFLGGVGRIGFWQKHRPVALYVHPRRMSFTENGQTDSIEYMHAVWQRHDGGYRGPTDLKWVFRSPNHAELSSGAMQW
jgi:hypothetical protein